MSYSAVDAGHLNVVVQITNNSDAAATAHCTVQATTPYGDIGFDYMDQPLGPRETKTGTFGLIVQNNAAHLVNKVTVKDC